MKDVVFNEAAGFTVTKNGTSPNELFKDFVYFLGTPISISVFQWLIFSKVLSSPQL